MERPHDKKDEADMIGMLRVRIIGGTLAGKTQAVLQESNGFTIVDGNPYQQWKDIRLLKVFEENGKGIVVLSRSEGIQAERIRQA